MKDSEKRLAAIGLVVAATIIALVLSKHMAAWQQRLAIQEQALDQEHAEALALLSETDNWKAHGAWLVKHQPVAASELEADTKLFDTLLQKAGIEGLTVLSKQPQEQVINAFYRQSGVTLTVKGGLSGVFRWIHGVQSPGEFCVVPFLKITPDKEDPTKVQCAVQFWRWYQPPTAKTL